jgi:hypothetical protein
VRAARDFFEEGEGGRDAHCGTVRLRTTAEVANKYSTSTQQPTTHFPLPGFSKPGIWVRVRTSNLDLGSRINQAVEPAALLSAIDISAIYI